MVSFRLLLPAILLILTAMPAIGQTPGSAQKATTDYQPHRYINSLEGYRHPGLKEGGLQPYYDLDEALQASAKFHKPVAVYFTAVHCTNASIMENKVLTFPSVLKKLKDEFLLVILYCDINKLQLPINEQYYSNITKSRITTIADKNLEVQISKFKANAQPSIFFVDDKMKKLDPRSYDYDPDPKRFLVELEKVKVVYKKELQR